MNFLEESFQLLGLTDITAIHGRAEEYARNKEYREQYDLCVSRAVSNLATLSEYCLPYVKKGGSFISYKSGTVQEETRQAEKAIKILGGDLQEITYFNLPDSCQKNKINSKGLSAQSGYTTKNTAFIKKFRKEIKI